jgi:hypothetical protein
MATPTGDAIMRVTSISTSMLASGMTRLIISGSAAAAKAGSPAAAIKTLHQTVIFAPLSSPYRHNTDGR